MKIKTIDEIESQFDNLADSDNFAEGEHHRLEGEHLFTPDSYPESPYELSGEKVKAFYRSQILQRDDALKIIIGSMKSRHEVERDPSGVYSICTKCGEMSVTNGEYCDTDFNHTVDAILSIFSRK